MPTINVDGQDIEVKNGENILEACLNAGLDLPYFCWHPSMGSIGSCRQCAVVQYQGEEDTRGKIVMGCMTPAMDGARFSLKAENAVEFREAIIESLMLNHPHDCPVCAEGGECHLQDMTVMVGHRDRRYRGPKNTHRNQYLGPLLNHEMNRCITCYRCVRYYRDYAGGTDLSAQASHDHTYFGRHQEGVLESEFSGNLVEVCPTGVFTDKTLLKQYTRKWDLQSAPSICTGCAVGCNTAPGERYGKLKRTHNRYNNEVNGYFLCDRGRFGGGYVNAQKRLNFAGLKNTDGSFAAISQQQAIKDAASWISSAMESNGNGKLIAIGSPRASIESNYLLRELVGAENFSSGFSDIESPVISRIAEILASKVVINPSIKQMETADAILILGEDVTNTAPRVALGLRQSVRNKALELADEARLFHWQDAAVRNLAQDQRSPMIIVSATDTRLDDVASTLISLDPEAISAFAQDVAKSLRGESSDNEAAVKTAEVLTVAKNPLIVSGSSMLHSGIIEGALEIAQALNSNENTSMLSYCLPEANSLGLALLNDANSQSLGSLADQSNDIDTLIILENDLSRRMPEAQYRQLMSGAKNTIVLDVLENSSMDYANMVIPSASFAESEGTLVSSEGRAQRHYPVYEPLEDRMAAWQWLLNVAAQINHSSLATMEHFDQVTEACAASSSVFSNLGDVAPNRNYRNHGLKVPRQTHRNSGRTAVLADVSVHEPQQTIDIETPLAYTMEGLNRDEPAALKPFYWAPGWNSNQAVQKFQDEVDGPIRGGPNGVRLFDCNGADKTMPTSQKITQSKDEMESGKWQLISIYRVHGSEELSVSSEEIGELSGEAFIAVGEKVAEKLSVSEGDGLLVNSGDVELSLEVKIISRVAKNCIGFSAGYQQTSQLAQGAMVSLKKDESWQRRTVQMIASDRGGRHV